MASRLSTLATLLLLLTPQLVSSLQVTPNSPCASKCMDSPTLDTSDPNSSNTRNSDIVCEDAKYASAAGTKFKDCMTCLEESSFSQGSESDAMWFLYNIRYAASYCMFGLHNDTAVLGSTPCTTSHACGPLRGSVEHGMLDQKKMTTYSYCSFGDQDHTNYERCHSCLSAEKKTTYLASFFVAMEAGCQQKPAPGTLLGLSDKVFSGNEITIVDPAEAAKESEKPAPLPTTVIIGIVVGVVVLLLVAAGVTFVCLRKRKNRINRASAQADFYRDFNARPQTLSFQCQTHMMPPRLWPGNEEGLSAVAESPADTQARRSSMWKGDPDSMPTYQAQESAPYYQHPDDITGISKKAAFASVPLHNITTNIPPTSPPQVYTASSEKVYYSPSDFKSPMSADSVRSTAALLPAIKPYVPAEHGVHNNASPTPQSAVSFTSSTPGLGMTPLLKSDGWTQQRLSYVAPQQVQQQQQPQRPQRPTIKLSMSEHVPPPPPAPAPSQGGIGLGLSLGVASIGKNKNGKTTPTGSPVESMEIKTAFKAPPRR
ncbi:hypothetical protein QBC35DRAFT_63096 [Podospora australis]|uniref:LPXTG-domain-containing protein n=1 Tax=Podospora australis TaxID=1536484 RepID=A0AAN6WZT6_9PEZI|nr:hypothetical protein QBC35DRAFT_63096 [Podospora australis]